jgi:hypothetical protein
MPAQFSGFFRYRITGFSFVIPLFLGQADANSGHLEAIAIDVIVRNS